MAHALILDFYGTLARATHSISVDQVLAEHGHELEPRARHRWFNDGIDGLEHAEHSISREHYVAWQRERTLGMLAETDIHPAEHEAVLDKLRAGAETRVLEAYDEVPEVLAAMRARGLRLAVCSNWDWDLDQALDEVGLSDAFDVVVSSAWAGARKPHPRVFAHTLDKIGAAPRDVVFVGDSWGPDVEGPGAIGMTPVYLRREGHWPDPHAPASPIMSGISVVEDLRGLFELL